MILRESHSPLLSASWKLVDLFVWVLRECLSSGRRVEELLAPPPALPGWRLPCGAEVSALFVQCGIGALFFLSELYFGGGWGWRFYSEV